MALKQKGAEAPADAKKRRRVGFVQIDSGIEANECIQIFLGPLGHLQMHMHYSKKNEKALPVEGSDGCSCTPPQIAKGRDPMILLKNSSHDQFLRMKYQNTTFVRLAMREIDGWKLYKLGCGFVAPHSIIRGLGRKRGVRSKDEVGTTNGLCIDPVDLNQFFGEDGKIYGYKDLKINIWLSCVSFNAFADITYSSTSNGGKGITDLKPALQNIFGESLVEKSEFLQTFSTENHYVRSIVSEGITVPCNSLRKDGNGSVCHSDTDESVTEVIRMGLHSLPVGLLYNRLVPLVLLLVEGGSPVDVTDPRWDIYFVVKKMQDQSGDHIIRLLGFATVYNFYHYPDSTRLRIGQILILPPYQGQGHGRYLLESVNFVAVSVNIYDVTIEEPSDYLQQLRTCHDTLRMLSLEPIKQAAEPVVSYLKEGNLSKRTYKLASGPPPDIIEIARQKLKINKKQFLRCWEVLIYLNLDHKNHRCMENFRACVSDRLKGEILDKDSETNGKQLIEVPNEYDHYMTFVVYWSGESEGLDGRLETDKVTQEQQLNQLVDKQIEDISEISKKVSFLHIS